MRRPPEETAAADDVGEHAASGKNAAEQNDRDNGNPFSPCPFDIPEEPHGNLLLVQYTEFPEKQIGFQCKNPYENRKTSKIRLEIPGMAIILGTFPERDMSGYSAVWSSAFDWGSKGREFKSLYPDHFYAEISGI